MCKTNITQSLILCDIKEKISHLQWQPTGVCPLLWCWLSPPEWLCQWFGEAVDSEICHWSIEAEGSWQSVCLCTLTGREQLHEWMELHWGCPVRSWESGGVWRSLQSKQKSVVWDKQNLSSAYGLKFLHWGAFSLRLLIFNSGTVSLTWLDAIR